MLALIKTVLQNSVDVLLPPRCLLCYERSSDPQNVCASCWKDIQFITAPQCMQCGMPFDFGMGQELYCAACIDHPPEFACMRSAVTYNDISRRLVLGFKHGDMLQLTKLLARWMVQSAGPVLQKSDIIVPVPLHRLRLLKRQYNQAALLANHISQLSKIKAENQLLCRVRHTPSQGRKTRKERILNLKSAIQVSPDYAILLQGKTVLLIDDVYTTGATVEECCRVLKLAGAKGVNVLTFARTVKGRN